MPLSKTDCILALINYFLLTDGINRYHFQADSIAYNTRKNSSIKRIEELIKEYLEIEDEDLIHQLAMGIKASL